jgi:hypothetical protein
MNTREKKVRKERKTEKKEFKKCVTLNYCIPLHYRTGTIKNNFFKYLCLAEMGTSDTFIDLPKFDTYRIQNKVSKYRTSKVSEDRISDHQISTFDSPVLSDTEKNVGTKKTKKMALYSPFSTKKRHFHEEKAENFQIRSALNYMTRSGSAQNKFGSKPRLNENCTHISLT